ncbi:hypothetical protein RIVM261_032630 [Rivularia sp. IAM M-261]|nr:hypothetical protein RIVM261_032630 [Rivularia sp. IAM M-261]
MSYWKNTCLVLLLSLFFVSITLSSASSDVLPPEKSPVSYCFQINNINKYLNYLLIAQVKSQNPNLPGYNRILRQNKCLDLNGYREYSEIFAIRKNQVKPQEIVKVEQGEEIKNFNNKKSLLIPVKDIINPVRTFDDKYSVNKIADVLEITAIKPKSVDLKYKQVIYTFKNGKTQTYTYLSQNNRPTPSIGTSNILNFVLPGLSIFGILLVWKKVRHQSTFKNNK